MQRILLYLEMEEGRKRQKRLSASGSDRTTPGTASYALQIITPATSTPERLLKPGRWKAARNVPLSLFLSPTASFEADEASTRACFTDLIYISNKDTSVLVSNSSSRSEERSLVDHG